MAPRNTLSSTKQTTLRINEVNGEQKMKNLMIGLVAAVTMISSAQAYNFRANARVHMSPTQGIVEVVNELNTRIVCSGEVRGMTRSGNTVYVTVNNVVVYPNSYIEAYVYTNNYDTFVRVMPRISCRTL